MMLLLFEILASLSAITSIMIYGNKSWYAPIFGLFSQIIWVSWVVVSGSWSMMALCIAMIIVHIRNIKKMDTKQGLISLWKKLGL